jgi:hypothetical protein
MGLNSSVCVIMCIYFLLTPWVHVGISTKFLVLVQKRHGFFCTSKVLTNYQTPRLGIQPRTCGNLMDQWSLLYHYASTREILCFPNLYQLWFFSKNSPRYDKTQESGVGRWLVYQRLAGFLLRIINRHHRSSKLYKTTSPCPFRSRFDTSSVL